jgi:Lon protease-like protein
VPQLLAIFPLELVLLPGAPLPLHIFEPRYKEMIGECLEQHRQFGVVRTKEGGLAEIGCTAEIVSVVKRYDDGRMDIATEGRRRFEVMHLDQERAFVRAEVVFVDDEQEAPATDLIKRVLQLHAEAIDVLGVEGPPPSAENRQLSYALAALLPVDLEFKQMLLSVRSESERLEGLIELYEAMVPELRKAVRRQQKAGGNGHVP